MATDSGRQSDDHPLEIALDSGYLPVSNVSSLLRTLQAALREVARSSDRPVDAFQEQPHPVLRTSTEVTGEEMVLRFIFFDPRHSLPMSEVSERTFGLFLDAFSEFIKRMPQRGLWGEAVGGARQQTYDSDVTKRMDQLRVELRRFPKARLTFNNRTITFEGDRMEIA